MTDPNRPSLPPPDSPLPFEGAALWRRLAPPAEWPPLDPTDPLTAADLAAWLDGRLDGKRLVAVEAWLSSDPHARDTVLIALDDPMARDQPAPPLPLDLVRRACALVPPSAGRAAVGSVGAGSAAGRLRAVLAWSSVAAALLVAGLVGLELGMTAGNPIIAVSHDAADTGIGTGGLLDVLEF